MDSIKYQISLLLVVNKFKYKTNRKNNNLYLITTHLVTSLKRKFTKF